MIASLVISITSIVCIILSTIIKPSIKLGKREISLYWVIALIALILIVASGNVPFSEWIQAVTSSGSMNPIKILTLFLSMTIISIFLDEVGFFSYLASLILSKVKGSQIKIFTSIYIMVALLTMFTSNDIVIFTLTPFLIEFSKRAKISPYPYLIGEFACANTWSMIFLIGNPTNIYLSQYYSIGFLEYFKVMAIPTVVTGIIEYLIIILLFGNKLKEKIDDGCEREELKEKTLTIIGLIVLLVTTIFLVISSYVSLPMYLICLIGLIVLVVSTLIYYFIRKERPVHTISSIKRASWELIPFVLGMFTICLSLSKYGITGKLSELFGSRGVVFVYGFTSYLSANLFNNIPMSILYSSIISPLEGVSILRAAYATIIGSNLGAILSPIGALAGIMWMSILKKHDIKYTFLDYVKYGFVISVPLIVVSVTLLSLFI